LIARRAAAIRSGAANALAARVIEDLGFEAIYVTGPGWRRAEIAAREKDSNQ